MKNYISLILLSLTILSGCQSTIQKIADETYDVTAAEAVRAITDLSELTIFKIELFAPSDRYWSRYGDVVIVARAIGDSKIKNVEKFEIKDGSGVVFFSDEVKCWHDAHYGPRLLKYVYVIPFGISFDDAKTIEGKEVQLVLSGKETSVPFVFEFPSDVVSPEKEYSYYFRKVESGKEVKNENN